MSESVFDSKFEEALKDSSLNTEEAKSLAESVRNVPKELVIKIIADNGFMETLQTLRFTANYIKLFKTALRAVILANGDSPDVMEKVIIELLFRTVGRVTLRKAAGVMDIVKGSSDVASVQIGIINKIVDITTRIVTEKLPKAKDGDSFVEMLDHEESKVAYVAAEISEVLGSGPHSAARDFSLLLCSLIPLEALPRDKYEEFREFLSPEEVELF